MPSPRIKKAKSSFKSRRTLKANKRTKRKNRTVRKLKGGERIQIAGWHQHDGSHSPSDDFVTSYEGSDYDIVAVFDGHSGLEVSDYASTAIIEHIIGQLEYYEGRDEETLSTILYNAFDEIGEKINEKFAYGGSTASVCIITDTHVVSANIGDSPIIIFDTDGNVSEQSVDHDCDNKNEVARIKKLGKKCTKKGNKSMYWIKINGGEAHLDMTRSFGDVVFDKGVIINEPQIYVWERVAGNILCICSDSFYENGTYDADGTLTAISATNTKEDIANEVVAYINAYPEDFAEAARQAVEERVESLKDEEGNYAGDNTTLYIARL